LQLKEEINLYRYEKGKKMIEEIFPTPIMVVDLSEMLDMTDVHERCLKIISQPNHVCEHGLVPKGVSSYNSNTPVITNDSIKDVKNIIMMQVRQLEKALAIYPLEFTNSWINIMPKESTIGSHLHPYSVISGAFYLNAGEGAGEFVIENPLYHSQMMMQSQGKSEYTKVFQSIEAKTGRLILFPSYLKHHVKGNNYEGRTVMSFNTNYDRRIDLKGSI